MVNSLAKKDRMSNSESVYYYFIFLFKEIAIQLN